ncbi:MAG TPA: hypothetical protein VFB65_02710 [Pyrinomonadaceae bacterium]|nr:hypothetical protein [Pyrinomonadaceae bacterium]
MNFRESTITKPLAILLTVAIVNITAFAAVILDGNARQTRMEIPTAVEYTKNIHFTPNKAFTYGVDKDKVAFAKANNSGATGRFLNLSPNHFKLQITRQNKVGEVEFSRISGAQTATRFTTAAGDTLVVQTTRIETAKDGANPVNLSFQYKNDKAVLKIDEATSRNGFSAVEEKQLRKISTHVQLNRDLNDLLADAKTFADPSVVSGATGAVMSNVLSVDSLACIIAAGECILIIASYVGSIAGLIALCPETIGATCLGVLLLHPVISVLVAAKCADALQKCGITPPPPPSKSQYQQACVDWGGSWNSTTEQCIPIVVIAEVCVEWGWYWYSTSGSCRQSSGGFQSCPPEICMDGLVQNPETCECEAISPVIVDVAGDGFNLTNGQNGVFFDHNGDGVKEKLSWTAANSDEAFLVLDRNGNGTIDSGQELFGNFTSQPIPPTGEERNGFYALAQFDRSDNGGNGDGQINLTDTVYSSLRLWQDTNHNGMSEPTELHRLSELGVIGFDLKYKDSKQTDQHGNQFRYRGKVTRLVGTPVARWAWDVFLQPN